MMTAVNAVIHWLLRRAAGRWPADQRADLMREWAGEVSTIAQDSRTRVSIRQWHMLAFGGSLALSPGVGQYAPFGVKRIAAVVAVLSMYLLGLIVLQYGWYAVYQSQGEGERPIIDDAGLPARLVVGAVALVPVVVAALAGWLTGRRSNRRIRPLSLGLCLIAVVAAWVGIGFLPPSPLPQRRSPSARSYSSARRPPREPRRGNGLPSGWCRPIRSPSHRMKGPTVSTRPAI